MEELDLREWLMWIRLKRDILEVFSMTKKIVLGGWMLHGSLCILVAGIKGILDV